MENDLEEWRYGEGIPWNFYSISLTEPCIVKLHASTVNWLEGNVPLSRIPPVAPLTNMV